MSLRGLLLKESLLDDSALDLVRVISTELSRIEDAVPPQPRWWTIVRFEVDGQGADEILQRFSVGTGSRKSVLARLLGKRLCLPAVHFDAILRASVVPLR